MHMILLCNAITGFSSESDSVHNTERRRLISTGGGGGVQSWSLRMRCLAAPDPPEVLTALPQTPG